MHVSLDAAPVEWRPLRLPPATRAAAALANAFLAALAGRARGAVRAVLATRPGAALRAALADASWTVRGMSMTPPVLPAAPRTLLFVCKGNICRSPFAAALAARLLADRTGVRCASAGFLASPAASPPDHAVMAAASHGVSLTHHRPARLTGEMVAASDLVVVMEYAHLARLQRDYPRHRDRIVLLPVFAPPGKGRHGYLRLNIPDPYGKPLPVFDACYAQTYCAVQGLIAAMRLPGPDRTTRSS